MVLNFFQLLNNTKFSFQLINSENNSDNYNVGPFDTTTRHDMWLAQGDGSKGVSVLTSADGSAISPFLYMWDQDSALRYRVGGEVATNAIAVNGSKDFSIYVYDNYFTFSCYNGSFNDLDGTTVTVTEWKDRITNDFSELIRDRDTIEYARDFAASDGDDDDDSGELRSTRDIEEPTQAQLRYITELIAMWDLDCLEPNRRQSTLYSLPDTAWRIDLQDNGAVQRNEMYYYNIAVQLGSGRNNVYAHMLLPVGYAIGRRRIRNALLHSTRNSIISIIIPPEPSLPYIRSIAYNSQEARTSWAVQTVQWECTDARIAVWQ